MTKQHGGGSVGQSLRYVDTAAPEQSAAAGGDLLIERYPIVRPAIGGGTRRKRGGFFPSVMGGVVNAGMLTLPLAGYSARKLLSRKTRKGGAKLAKWLAQKEEAKAMLAHYGKPSARNIQAYAIARRRGSNVAEQYLNDFRKRKQEKAEANEAKRVAKEAAKAQKKRERNEKKAASKKNKPPKKPRSTKKAKKENAVAAVVANEAPKKGKHLFFNNEGEVINTAARNKALESLGKRVASPRPTTPTVNRPKTPVSNKPKTPAASAAVAAAVNSTKKKGKKEKKAKKANNGTAKPRKSPSAASKKYFEELRKAREYLGTIGAPTGPNMSKYASMKLRGENTSAFEENFKTRRPLSLATAKKPRKTKTVKAKKNEAKPASPKPLSAVKEENENYRTNENNESNKKNKNNENEMQGYSENFEPESESESSKEN